MEGLKLISSAYAGKCRQCRTPHDKGGMVWWQKGIKGVLCQGCKDGAAESSSKASEAPRKVEKEGKVEKGKVGKKALRRWDSWKEYVDYAATMKESGRQGSFYGGMTQSQAIDLARKGWNAPRAEIDALTDKISEHLSPMLVSAFTSVFDVVGGSVDVGRFLDGEPECMVETQLVEIAKEGKIVSILVNGCFGAGIYNKEIRQRGAAIVGLIDALDKCQYRTEVWLEVSHKTVSYLVKVKGAEDMLNVDVLMFAIGHEACFRQLNFAIQDSDDKGLCVDKAHGMGYVWKLSCQELVDANICLEPLKYGDETANAEVWIKKQLSRYGLLREDGK